MAATYEALTVQKLKQELIRRQAATTGRKTDLVERLKAYDRNDDFRGTVIHLPEPLDARWPSSGFRQLLPKHQSILPPISKELTEGYFFFFAWLKIIRLSVT
ncbi:uncharacterized protein LOC124285270 [Haliotis rubra]|uniref:uncharacterized protein LOC124285270 n=1 Tax=Haliotis rubra TaxID=36100 RepID=UPI001EE4EEF3|nr:uncharacterized protein LOC124285270 [Haliotis rubra]